MSPGGAAFHGGSGPPAVLLHGLFMSWHAWQPVLADLQRHHEVLAPTLTGHRGGPAWPADRIGIGPLVDAVEERLDAAGWDRAHLVGNSLGGWLALELARRGRAHSVVALSPAGTWTGRPSYLALRAKLRLAAGLARRDLLRHRAVRGPALRAMVAHPARVPADRARAMPLDARACTALGPLEDWFRRHGSLASYDVGGVPVRIAWPVHDRTIPWRHHGVVFRGLVPGAEFVRLPGVGHVPMTDDPALVARTILEVTARGA